MKKRKFRIKRKKPIYRKKVFWLFIFFIFFLAFLFYIFVFSSFFQIREISISGAQKVSPQKIREFLEKTTEKKILFWKTKSIFLVDRKNIQEEIEKNNPEIESVKIKKDLSRSLIVEIKERIPVAIFCQDESCFFLDKNGIVFEQTSKTEDLLVIEKDTTNSSFQLGEKIISSEVISEILKIENRIRDLKFSSLLMEDPHKFIFYAEEGPEIFFDFQGDINQQIFNLETFLREKINSEKLDNIEYIDVRFGNRVFWKEKSPLDSE